MTTTEVETPNAADYAGPVKFDEIDKHIAWAEAEAAKGEKGRWNQGNWGTTLPSCGTAFCIAGHAAVISGYRAGVRERTTDEAYLTRPGQKFAWLEDWSYVILPGVDRGAVNKARAEDEKLYDYFVEDDHPELVKSTERVGAELLGINDERFDLHEDGMPTLFAGDNSVFSLKRIRDQYARMEGYPTKYEEEVS